MIARVTATLCRMKRTKDLKTIKLILLLKVSRHKVKYMYGIKAQRSNNPYKINELRKWSIEKLEKEYSELQRQMWAYERQGHHSLALAYKRFTQKISKVLKEKK